MKIKKSNGHKFFSGARNVLSYSFARENCIRCNRSCFGLPLCKSCETFLRDYKIDFENRCLVCGKELLSENRICTSCRNENRFVHADKVLSILPYRLWIKNLVFQWKMGDRRSLSPLFSQLIKKGLDSLGLEPENALIVPVPPRPGKIRAKGWDQVDELCDFLKKLYGFDVIKILERLSSVQQKKMNRDERLCTKGKSYRLKKNWKDKYAKYMEENQLENKNYVLVDDVITTGVTVDSCAEILRNMGVKHVKVLSLVIVD